MSLTASRPAHDLRHDLPRVSRAAPTRARRLADLIADDPDLAPPPRAEVPLSAFG